MIRWRDMDECERSVLLMFFGWACAGVVALIGLMVMCYPTWVLRVGAM